MHRLAAMWGSWRKASGSSVSPRPGRGQGEELAAPRLASPSTACHLQYTVDGLASPARFLPTWVEVDDAA
jgi:hypothetical protein